MNENRQYNLDLLKALAIICMIFSHPVLVFALYRNGWDSGFLYILGDIILGDYIAVAHAFMLAMGVGMVFSRKTDPASLVKRGIKIFLGGYVLNFFRRGMYLLITDLIRHETGTEALDAVLAPDILQFAGLALIVTGIFFKLKLKEIHILIIGIALSIIGALVPVIYTGIYVLDVILGNFIFVSRSCSTFAFCSWYVFVAAGLFFGSLLRASADKDRFYGKLLWSGCIAAVYIVATFILGMFYFSPDNDYYRVGIADAAGLLSMDFFALSVFYFMLKKTGAEKFSAFIEMSRNITPIYVIHWCIIGFTDFVLCELLGFVFTYPIMYAYGAVLIIVSFFLARLYRKERDIWSFRVQKSENSNKRLGSIVSESLKNNKELYEKTNPVFNTAKMTLFQLAQQGNTHAAKISEKLGLTEDTQKSQSFSMGPEEEMTFRIILETRYHMMGILAQDSGFSVFVDLPCGYTPRAIETAEHSSSYIGLDLPPVISEISGIILPMISSEKQSFVRFNPVDATNGRSLEKALEDVKENICINTEGLLMYFSDAEIHSFLENIKKLLNIHGGCWITADPEIMPEHIRILGAIHPGDTNHDTDSILNEKADVSVTTNSLMVRYGHEKEDVEKVKDILSEHGLKAERIRIGSHIVATKAFSLLTPEQGSAVLKAVEDIAFWKVVSAGLSENNAGTDQHFTIRKEYTDGVLFLELTGRLDSLTAPQLLAKYEKQNASDVIRKVQIDCHALDYISSAGLRVLLIMQKGCKEGVSLKGMNDLVRDILDQTGFSEIIQMTV